MNFSALAPIVLETEGLRFAFWNSGDIREATYDRTMVNQWISNPIDGSLNNLYLRIFEGDHIRAFPLLGIRSGSKVHYSNSQVISEGEVEGLRYKVTFTLTPHRIWFWDVQVEGRDAEVDIVYGQDVGIADTGAVRSNEAYVSQYIDHSVFKHSDRGFVVCSRQNQPQGGKFPYVQQGSLSGSAGYSTDGFQFFGLSYKETNEPEALASAELANEVYQYEFAYIALQSGRTKVNGTARFVFYGLYKPDHPEAVTALEYEDEIMNAWKHVEELAAEELRSALPTALSTDVGEPLAGATFTPEDINRLFPARRHEEHEGSELLSFFTDTHEHVVLKAKELSVERPHGHILLSGRRGPGDDVLASTSFMYGIFNSHIVVGNTTFNKMMTNARNALNIMKTAGQRLYIEIGGSYRLLTMPSLFEIGFNYTRWFYKTADDLLVITSYTTVDAPVPEVRLHVRSESGKSYRFLVTNQVTMSGSEYEAPYRLQRDGDTLTFHAGEGSLSANFVPQLHYRMRVTGAAFNVQDEARLASNVQSGSASLTVLELDASSDWSMAVQGVVQEADVPFADTDLAQESAKYREQLSTVMNGFRVSLDGQTPDEMNKINALAWWYTHNMLVHYSSPHGLEQYGGAAWGTRDVCQGPAEYFLANQNYGEVRHILSTVYSHQFEEDGNWPQWFMFDQYLPIQADESHGDIIVWPLKLLSDYLKASGDYGILDEKLPYTKKHPFAFTEEQVPLRDHVMKQIDYIKQHFLHDTHLSSYGDGDWDDTLQPANAKLKQYLISSWTVALTYQSFRQFSEVLSGVDGKAAEELRELAAAIAADFERYMLQSDVIPGFVYMEEPGKPELMLHPTDTKTGIQYRLLPMTRSMIAELLTPEQAESHYKLIKKELFFPDGVRLMNKPSNYVGGVSVHFKRAQQAANFGREIGLQYVHAHIRFIEAMAKLGNAGEAWRALQTINPVAIRDVVPNAELRQSNSYFSSSDGKFSTRKEAQERFDDLRDGSAGVKGGWRIYSSGPGIYMNQLITNCLGIRIEGETLHLDPVLPPHLDGLRFEFTLLGKPVVFVYRIGGSKVSRVTVNGNEVAGEAAGNRYRQGGIRIPQQEWSKHLTGGDNVIEIHMEA